MHMLCAQNQYPLHNNPNKSWLMRIRTRRLKFAGKRLFAVQFGQWRIFSFDTLEGKHFLHKKVNSLRSTLLNLFLI